MFKSPIALTIFLMSHYGIMEAKVVDIHFRTPEEEKLIEDHQKKKENEEASHVLEEENSSHEEKIKALETLLGNGVIG